MAKAFQLDFDPFGVQKQLLGSSSPYGGTNAAKVPKLSKTEMKEMLQAQQEALFNQETATIAESLASSPFWAQGSTKQREAFLKHWEENNWKSFAEQRWGADYARNIEALAYKNAVISPLSSELKQLKKETEGIGPWFSRTFAGTGAGLDRAETAMVEGNALGMAETLQNQRINELEQLKISRENLLTADTTNDPTIKGVLKHYDDRVSFLERQAPRDIEKVEARTVALREAQQADLEADMQRLEENKAYLNYQLRGQELDLLYADSSTLLRRIAENPTGVANILLSEAIQQAPNMLPPLVGGALGSVLGPAGTALGVGFGSGAIVAGSVVSDSASEIYNTPIEDISRTPGYKQLAAEGLDDQQIRDRLVQRMAERVWLPAAGVGMATSILSPEALFLAKSPLSKLLSGQLAKRITQLEAQGLDRAAIQQTIISEFPKNALRTSWGKHAVAGTFLSSLGEYGEEGTEQFLQNHGWNVATGDDRDPFSGVAAAATTGGLLAIPTGLIGGITGTMRENAAVSKYVQARQTEAQRTARATGTPAGVEQVGGFNVIRANPDGTVTPLNTTNPDLAPEKATRMAEATEYVRNATALADDIINSRQVPSEAQVSTLINNLYDANIRGTSPEIIESVLNRVQANAAFPPDSTVNVHSLYETFSQRMDAARQQINMSRPATVQTPRTHEEQLAALQSAQANIQTELTQLQSQPILANEVASTTRTDRLSELQQLNEQVTQALTDLETSRNSSDPASAYLSSDVAALDNIMPSMQLTFDELNNVLTDRALPALTQSEYTSANLNGMNVADVLKSQTERAGNQNNKNAKVDELRRQQADGVWIPQQDQQLTPNEVAAVQSENMNVTLPPDADNATTFDYVRNELLNAGRDEEMAAIDAMVLCRMLDTLGEFTGESRAQQLQRLNFGLATDVNAVVNSYAQSAFVGSPYHFDQFSTDHIGSGEGSQIEGWGLYAAELESIAKGYAYREAHNLTVKYGEYTATRIFSGVDSSGRNQFIWNMDDGRQAVQASILSGREISDPVIGLMDEVAAVYFIVGKKRALEHANGRLTALYLQLDETDPVIQNSMVELSRMVDAIENDALSVEHDAQVYEIDIPDNEYLLWDAPFTKQPAYVQERLSSTIDQVVTDINNTLTELNETWPAADGRALNTVTRADITGRDLYDHLVMDFDSSRAASLYLSTLGIQGNKYLDGFSRTKGHGTYNYVIFNDQAIQILDTFYQAQGRGRVDFLNDGTANIIFGDKADASTAIHEFQHFFINEALRTLNDPTIKDSPQMARFATDMRTLAEFAGVHLADALDTTAWGRTAHEKVASAFERYFRTGQAPTTQLESIFKRMKELLIQLYQRASDILRGPISPQVRAVFDRQLTGYVNEQFRQTTDQAAARIDRRSYEARSSAKALARQSGTTTIPTSVTDIAGLDATATGTGISGTEYADTGALITDVQPDQQVERGVGAGTDRGRNSTGIGAFGPTTAAGERSRISAAEQRPSNVRRTADVSEPAVADAGKPVPAIVARRDELVREYVSTAAAGIEADAVSPELRATAEFMADYTLSLEFGPKDSALEAYAETITINKQEIAEAKTEAVNQAQKGIPSAKLPKPLTATDPKYSYGGKDFTLLFDSDIDRAAFIIADPKKSKSDTAYLNFIINTTGLTSAEAREYGGRVRDTIRNMAKNANPGVLTIPVQQRTAGRSFLQAEHITALVESELTIDPNLQHTAAAQLNGTEEETIIIHSGSMLPEVAVQLDGLRSSDMDGDTALTAGNPSNAITPVIAPNPAQEAAQKQVLSDDIFMLLAESGVPFEGSIIDNPDGTINVALVPELPAGISTEQHTNAISQIDRIGRERNAALVAGLENQRRRQDEAEQRGGGLSRVAGRSSNMATAFKSKFNFAGARIEQMFNHIFPSTDGNFDSNSGTQATRTAQIQMSSARATIEDVVFKPIYEQIIKTANLTGFDEATVSKDVGFARTYLHVLEVEPIKRMELETNLQQALATGDVQAINKAQSDLDAYVAMQTAPDPDIVDANGEVAERVKTKAFGGMPAWEAQQLLNELIAKYAPYNEQFGGDLLAVGVQKVGDGYANLVNIAAGNGLIDAETIAQFGAYNFYAALYTDKEKGTHTENDIAMFMPNQIYHREGSTEKAIDSFTALDQFAARVSMNLGQTEFVNQLNLAYEKLLSEGLTPEQIQARWGLVRVDYKSEWGRIEGVHSSGNYAAYQAMKRSFNDVVDIVGNVLVEQEDGAAAMTQYGFGFDKNTHPEFKKALVSLFKPVKHEGLLGLASDGTKFMGRTMTYYRLMFPAAVGIRDTIERFTYLPTKRYYRTDGSVVSGTEVAARTAAYMLNPANQIRMAKRFITGKANAEHLTFNVDRASKMDAYLDEYINSGGKFTIADTLKNKVVSEVKKNMLQKTWDMSLGKLDKALSKFSDFFYMQPGFAQYTAMRDMGISSKDSVAGVNELMNMRHTGEWTGKLSWAFPFMNSITQTAGQVMGALGMHSGWGTGNPHMLKNAAKGWGVLTAIGIGMSQLAPLLREALGYDDDFGLYYKMDMMPIGQLSTFLPIPVDGGTFKFPTGFGLSQLGVMLGIVQDRVSRGVMNPADATFAVVSTFAKNMVPNSAPAYAFSKDPFAYIMQTISPVWLAPVMQVVTNRTYTGAPVSYAKAMGSKDQRLSDTGSPSTAEVWKDGAKLIYNLTRGVVDVPPELIRTIVNGYATGILQAIPIMMEGNDFTKVDGFENSRDQLGPFWTAVGASVWYGPEANTTSRAFYDMLDHYNDRIKRAGVGKILTSSGLRGDDLTNYKTQLLSAIGWNPQEISDYLNIQKKQNYINNKVTPTYTKMLNEWKRTGADIDIMKNIWLAYKSEQVEQMGEVLMGSYYYSPDYQRRWGMPNKSASDAIRSSYY